MAVTAGPSPWDHENFWSFREGYKRLNKRTSAQYGVQHVMGTGYVNSTWDKEPRQPQMETVTLANGRKVQVPKGDYDDYIAFKKSQPSQGGDEIDQYIQKAWDGKTDEVEGVGHILSIKYSTRYQVMWVEFENDGAVVVFFRVPKEVYGELYHLAVSKATQISAIDGTQRHTLGIKFWDLVRIRGQREGSRYRYEYSVEGERTGTGFQREMAAGEKAIGQQYSGVDATAESADVYNTLARNMLKGEKFNEYNKLKDNKDKARFLRKAGIL